MPVKEPFGRTNPYETLDAPLWCVYGHECFPSIILCRIKKSTYDGSINIWGYSIYKRQPGFRTLGIGLDEWHSRHENVCFFKSQGDAMMHLIDITTNRAKS